ncbi:MAG: hypothetical protein NDI94_05320 [Candidatus Woesearchaeota archaeon]|nr:hypothetical protein [Candidatus Woesearchaeota archaeon]
MPYRSNRPTAFEMISSDISSLIATTSLDMHVIVHQNQAAKGLIEQDFLTRHGRDFFFVATAYYLTEATITGINEYTGNHLTHNQISKMAAKTVFGMFLIYETYQAAAYHLPSFRPIFEFIGLGKPNSFDPVDVICYAATAILAPFISRGIAKGIGYAWDAFERRYFQDDIQDKIY